jgi:hypothetical protein
MYIVKAHHKDTEETLYFHEWEELDEDGFDYDYYHEWSNCQASAYKDKEIALKSAIRFTGFTCPEFDYIQRVEIIKI